jgi:hypothetical protein
MYSLLTESTRGVGTAWPARRISCAPQHVKRPWLVVQSYSYHDSSLKKRHLPQHPAIRPVEKFVESYNLRLFISALPRSMKVSLETIIGLFSPLSMGER